MSKGSSEAQAQIRAKVYQLCRHNDAGEVRWTWRRTAAEMTNLYAELGEDLARRRHDQVTQTLQRIANQPGFHGVRAQSAALFAFATDRGYKGPLPSPVLRAESCAREAVAHPLNG